MNSHQCQTLASIKRQLSQVIKRYNPKSVSDSGETLRLEHRLVPLKDSKESMAVSSQQIFQIISRGCKLETPIQDNRLLARLTREPLTKNLLSYHKSQPLS